MKRFFLLILTLMAFPPASLADLITIDLDSASIDELSAARSAIDAKISDIALASAPDKSGIYLLSGKGTQILDGITLSSNLSRFVVTSNDAKVTYYSGDESNTLTCSDGGTYTYFEKPTEIQAIMVESSSEWKIDASPIGWMDDPYITGSGIFISDRFEVQPPVIVTISINHDRRRGWSNVALSKVKSDGSVYTEWIANYVKSPTTIDAIIKPEKDVVSYFWRFNCPESVEWSITAK